MTRIELRTADREYLGYINVCAPAEGLHDLLDSILIEGINQGGFLVIVESKDGDYTPDEFNLLPCYRHGNRVEQYKNDIREKTFNEVTA